MKVKLSVDNHCIKDTPKSDINFRAISKTIAKNQQELTLSEIAKVIEDGYTISSPIYKNEEKKLDNVTEMQLFILDFDGKEGSELKYQDALDRAEYYNLPVVISYETKSSVDFSRYRLIFLYNEPIKDHRMMNLINQLLLRVFPEADSSTKDISKMFLPGRNVRLHDGKPFYLDTLIIAARYHCYSLAPDSKSTWVNFLKSLNHKYGLITDGTDIYTSDEINPLKKGNMNVSSIYYYMECAAKLPKNRGLNYIYFGNSPSIKVKKDTIKKPRLKSLDIIGEECMLMSSFEAGNRLEHSEWFGLATNLINIVGGKTRFIEIINKYSSIYDRTELKIEQVESAIRKNYKPYNCDVYCPHSDECPHSANMVLTLKEKRHAMKRVKGYEEQFISIEDVRNRCRAFYYEAVSNNCVFNILKAPTGSGKSTLHLEFLNNIDHRTINAYPNSGLMMEKYNEAISLGIDVVHTPIIEELYPKLTEEQADEIRSLYEIGAGELPSILLKQWSHGNPFIKEYLTELENIPDNAHIFTTHSRLFRLSASVTEDSYIFIDEDIIPSMISCSGVSTDEFFKLHGIISSGVLKNKLEMIRENISDEAHFFKLPKTFIPAEFKSKVMDQCNKNGICFSQNIWGLIEADNYFYYPADKCIHFTVSNQLPHSKKVIMMSATANEQICKYVFGNSLYFRDTGSIEYKGKVVIHCEKSYSRADLKAHDAEKIIKGIVDNHGDCAYITFKEYCRFIDKNFRKTHYGQAIGTNDFNGEDLVIIGLNHRPFYVYELFARELGINCSDTLSTRKAELNGFEFYMMTYTNEDLRNIQQYMIGSDLEQAIGRSRLIYNDCTVHLYGNFPAQQGILEKKIK